MCVPVYSNVGNSAAGRRLVIDYGARQTAIPADLHVEHPGRIRRIKRVVSDIGKDEIGAGAIPA